MAIDAIKYVLSNPKLAVTFEESKMLLHLDGLGVLDSARLVQFVRRKDFTEYIGSFYDAYEQGFTNEEVQKSQNERAMLADQTAFFASYWGVKCMTNIGDGKNKHPIPNICRMFDVGGNSTHWGGSWLILELKRLTETEAINLGYESLAALLEDLTIDEIRGLGYATAYKKYSVEQLVGLGWVKIIE